MAVKQGLTGKVRLGTGCFGRLALECEVHVIGYGTRSPLDTQPASDIDYFKWIDAPVGFLDKLDSLPSPNGDNLTGEVRYRLNWRKQVIVQVQYRTPGDSPGSFIRHWRDAKLQDFFNKGIQDG